MSSESLIKLIDEVRRDYQIPPFAKNETLNNYAYEGENYLEKLNPGKNIETDHMYRMLLKNYIHYAYYHRTNEWKQNYAQMITEWMLTSEVES